MIGGSAGGVSGSVGMPRGTFRGVLAMAGMGPILLQYRP